MSSRRVSVVVAAHQTVVRCGLVSMLSSAPDFLVVATCRESSACLEAIRALSPDLAVLDSSLPDRGGAQVLGAVRSERLSTQLIFLSAAIDSSCTTELIAKGAHCVLPMDASLNTLIRHSRTALDEHKAPSAHEFRNGRHPSPNGRAENPCVAALTERERQIIRLVCEGLSNKEIGRKCNLSEGTVKVHLHNIYEKLAIHNRTALAVLAAADLRASGGNDETGDARAPALELAPATSIPKAAGHLNHKLD